MGDKIAYRLPTVTCTITKSRKIELLPEDIAFFQKLINQEISVDRDIPSARLSLLPADNNNSYDSHDFKCHQVETRIPRLSKQKVRELLGEDDDNDKEDDGEIQENNEENYEDDDEDDEER